MNTSNIYKTISSGFKQSIYQSKTMTDLVEQHITTINKMIDAVEKRSLSKKQMKRPKGYVSMNLEKTIDALISNINEHTYDLPTDYRNRLNKTIGLAKERVQKVYIDKKPHIENKTFLFRLTSTEYRDLYHSKEMTIAKVRLAMKYHKMGQYADARQIMRACKTEILRDGSKWLSVISPDQQAQLDGILFYNLALIHIDLNPNENFKESRDILRHMIREYHYLQEIEQENNPEYSLPKPDQLLLKQAKIKLRDIIHLGARSPDTDSSTAILHLLTFICKEPEMTNFQTYYNLAVLYKKLDISHLIQNDSNWRYAEDVRMLCLKTRSTQKRQKISHTNRSSDQRVYSHNEVKKRMSSEGCYMSKEVVYACRDWFENSSAERLPLTLEDALNKAKSILNNLPKNELKTYYELLSKAESHSKPELCFMGISPSQFNETSNAISEESMRRSEDSKEPLSVNSTRTSSYRRTERIKIKRVTQNFNNQNQTVSTDVIIQAKPKRPDSYNDDFNELKTTFEKFGFTIDDKILDTYTYLGALLMPRGSDFKLVAMFSTLLFERDNEVDMGTSQTDAKKMLAILENGNRSNSDIHPIYQLAEHIHIEMNQIIQKTDYWKPTFDSLKCLAVANKFQKKLNYISTFHGVPLERYYQIRFDDSGVDFLLKFCSQLLAVQSKFELDPTVFEHPIVKQLFRTVNDEISKLNDLDSENKEQYEVKDEKESWSEPYQRFMGHLIREKGVASFCRNDFECLDNKDYEWIKAYVESLGLAFPNFNLTNQQLETLQHHLEHKFEKDNNLKLVITKKSKYNPFDGIPLEDSHLYQRAFNETGDALNHIFFESNELIESVTVNNNHCVVTGIEKRHIDCVFTAAKLMKYLNHWGASAYNFRYHGQGRSRKEY